MPLEILGALVVGGIALVAALVHWTGGGDVRRFTEAEARAAFLSDFPARHVVEVMLADDGRAALIATRNGLGVVRAMGRHHVSRTLPRARATVGESAVGLTFRTGDFAAPRLDLAFPDPDRRRAALALARSRLAQSGLARSGLAPDRTEAP